MKNKKTDLGTMLFILSIVLILTGGILYLGSYFWGFFLIVAAVGAYYSSKRITEGAKATEFLVRAFLKQLSIPAIGILVAILLGGMIMLITGYNPITAFKALFYGGFVKNWHVAVLNATPLIFTGLSIAFAFNGGLFNIGAEGQYYIGIMVSTWLGLRFGIPAFLAIPVIFVVSGAVAASYNAVPAILKVKTGVHEVITTMMFAHIARYISPIFIRANGGDPASSTHAYVTDTVNEQTWLPMFKSFLPNANYRLHTGILIAIATALLVYYLLYKTKYGFEIRAVGVNKDAARAQGISVGKNIFRALLFAGFLAGLSGVTEILGLTHKMHQNLSAGYGWNGIAVALLAGNNPIGVIFTAILWGSLDAGGQYMTRTTQTPNSIVEIIKGVILFLIVAKYIYSALGGRLKKWQYFLKKGSSMEGEGA